MPKISVIVPIYKVEKYFNRCVDSILNQTFTDFELILIDDGSPDNCGKICDEYAAKDKRVVVIHKPNGGLSDARNAGIDWSFANSNSEYIAFVDSDDWVHEQYLEKLYTSLTISNADLAICDFINVDENNYFEKDVLKFENEVIDQKTAFERLLKNWHYVVAWNKLYKKSIFKKLRYPKGKLHEDEYLIHRILNNCATIVSIDDKLYYYFQRSDSIMSQSKNVQMKLFAFEAFLDRYQLLKQLNYDDIAVAYFLKLEDLFSILNSYKGYDIQQFNFFVKLKILFRPIYFSYKRNRKITKLIYYDMHWLYSFLKGNKNNAEN